MRTFAATQPVVAILEALIEQYRFDPAQPDLVRLRELALTFGRSLPDFASHLQRFSDSVLYDPRAEAVTMSTLHAAKGLEFPVVFIAGCEEGLLPLAPRTSMVPEVDIMHWEEERRLFYVGMTRAIASLTLTWCQARSLYGGPAEPCQPSRFLEELPAASLSPLPAVQSPAQRRKPAMRQLSLFG
jgi:superfamily I DNA/RNA helicase